MANLAKRQVLQRALSTGQRLPQAMPKVRAPLPPIKPANPPLKVGTAQSGKIAGTSPDGPYFNYSLGSNPFDGYPSGVSATQWLQSGSPGSTIQNPAPKSPTGNPTATGNPQSQFPNVQQLSQATTPDSSYYPFDPAGDFYQPTPDENKAFKAQDDALHGTYESPLVKALDQNDQNSPYKIPPLNVTNNRPPMVPVKQDGNIGRGLLWDPSQPNSSGWVRPPSFYNQPKSQLILNKVRQAIPKAQNLASIISSLFRS